MFRHGFFLLAAFYALCLIGCSAENQQSSTSPVSLISPPPTTFVPSKAPAASITVLPQITQTPKTLEAIQISGAGGIITGDFPGFHPADWSPDGKRFAYTLNDSLRLIQMQDHSDRILLTISQAKLGGVYFSPDGNHLAVEGSKFDEALGLEANIIRSVDGHGSDLKDLTVWMQLFPFAKEINQWLTNTELGFTIWRGNGVQSLYVADISTNQSKTLIADRVGCSLTGGYYYFSPNNQYVAFDTLNSQLVWGDVKNLADCKKLTNAQFPLRQSFQGWLSDNQHFLYTEYTAGDPDLGVYSSDVNLRIWDISPNTFTRLLEGVAAASPSPDGTKIAFLRQKNKLWDYARLNGLNVNQSNGVTELELGVFDLQTNQEKILGPAGYKAEENSDLSLRYWQLGKPVWSPDGKLLAYWGDDGNTYLESFDGSWRQQLTNDLDIVQFLWSPDGTKLAFRTMDQAWIIENPKK